MSTSVAEPQLAPKKKGSPFNLFKRNHNKDKDQSDNSVVHLTHLDAHLIKPFAVRGDDAKLQVNGEKKARGFNIYVPWSLKKDVVKKDALPANNNVNHIDKSTEAQMPRITISPTPAAAEPIKPKLKITIQEFQDQFYQLAMGQIDEALKNGQKWDGTFPESCKEYKNLQKRTEKAHLLQKDTDLKKWSIYVRIQCASNTSESPVAQLLPELFEKIRTHLSHKTMSKDDTIVFWKSTEQLVHNLTEDWILQSSKSEKDYFSDDPDTLKILGVLSNYFANRRVILEEAEANAQTQFVFSLEKLQTAVSNQAKKIFKTKIGPPTLDNLIQGTQALMMDLYNDQDYLKKVFQCHGLPSHLNAYDIVYSMWDYELSESVKVLQQESLSNLQPIQFIDGNPNTSQNFDYKHDDSLFELYKVLRNFSMLTDKPPLPNFVHIKGSFHNGFRPFVTQWLDIVCLKTVSWIERAVQKDSFEPTSRNSKISESAVHTVGIFIAMKALWTELKWPDVEEAYSYAILMLENFSRCMQQYVEKVYRRVQELEAIGFEKFEISEEFCMASNNVEHVRRELKAILEQLCISDIIRKLSVGSNPNSTAMEQCISTPPNLIQNLTEKVNRRMCESLVFSCAKQIDPMLQILYLHVARVTEKRQAEIGSDQILAHITGILMKLKAHLTETEFSKDFPIIWKSVFDSLHTFVKDSLVTIKEPIFYRNLGVTFKSLCALFFGEDLSTLSEFDRLEIEELGDSIRLNGSTTRELILEYFQEKIKTQILIGRTEQCDKLSLIIEYSEPAELLRIKILNAALAKVKHGDPKCFVRFQLHTRGDKPYPKYYTRMKRGPCPLFEQEFELKVPKAELASGAFLHLRLKQGLYPMEKFLGETFLSLENIPSTSEIKTNLDTLPQTKLPLSIPTESKLFPVLERRGNEALAFVTAQRSRIHSSHSLT